MPAKSSKQYRLMVAAEHNPEIAAKSGIPQSVAEEFVNATPKAKRSSWSKKGWGRKGHR